MDPSFGARLRLQRERHQVGLPDIAERTKIKLALLEGLERDDVSNWPSGIFRRSYVRAYAQAIGLEPDAVVREFLECHPDPSEALPEPLAAAVRAGGSESTRMRPPTRLRFLIGSALGAIPTLRSQQGQGRGLAPDPFAAAPAGGSPLVDRSSGAAGNAAAVDNDTPPHRHAIDVELSYVAHLCTRLARASEPQDVVPVLEEAARLLDAVGLIVWTWDIRRRALRHVLSLGYSDEVLAQLPDVPADADNAIAAAFRSAETRVVNGNDSEPGAVVVPLSAPSGCAGVLAFELQNGGERQEHVRAFASILAAQLSTLVGSPSPVDDRAADEGAAPWVRQDFFARES